MLSRAENERRRAKAELIAGCASMLLAGNVGNGTPNLTPRQIDEAVRNAAQIIDVSYAQCNVRPEHDVGRDHIPAGRD